MYCEIPATNVLNHFLELDPSPPPAWRKLKQFECILHPKWHYLSMDQRAAVRAHRGGFTLVELLVVIGIMLVLVAVVVAGIRHSSQISARHQTRACMKICQDMLESY